MKNSIIVFSAALLTLASCKKTQDQVAFTPSANPSAIEISTRAGQQIANLQQELNGAGASRLKLLGFTKVGTVKDEAEKTALLSQIFGSNVRTVVGSLNNPEQIKVVSERDVVRSEEQQQSFDKMKAHVAGRASIGTDIIEVKWLLNGTTVEKTTALADANGIIWDNFMNNLPKFSVEEGQAQSTYDAAARTQVFTAAPVSVRAVVLGAQVAQVTYNLQAVWDYNVKQYTSKIHNIVRNIGVGGAGDGRGNSFWPSTTKKTVQGFYAIVAASFNVSFSFSGGSGGNTAWSVSVSGLGVSQKNEGFKLINTPVNP